MTKKEVKALGYWPQWFTQNLVSAIPPITTASNTILVWKCPIHGEYKQQVGTHLINSKCPKCSRAEGIHNAKRLKNPIKFDDCLDSIERQNSSKIDDILTFFCKKHGEYKQSIASHMRGRGCPICGREKSIRCAAEARRSLHKIPTEKLNELRPDYRKLFEEGKLKIADYGIFVCKEHGEYRQTLAQHFWYNGCPTCARATSSRGSSYEDYVCSILDEYNIQYVQHYKLQYDGKNPELDIVIPDKHLAFEINGLYWHSYEHIKISSKLCEASNYHKLKTELAKAQGIQLIHLWEDDFYKRGVLRNFILGKLKIPRIKIGARSLKATESKDSWLLEWHIQGKGQGKIINLSKDGKLYATAQFKKLATGEIMLDRYVTRPGYQVLGGLMKCIKYNGKGVYVTFADLAVSTGELYTKSGWTLVDELRPDYRYIVKGKRYHKFLYRISRFRNDENLKFEEGLTEFQLAALNNIERIYDCGKLKYKIIV